MSFILRFIVSFVFFYVANCVAVVSSLELTPGCDKEKVKLPFSYARNVDLADTTFVHERFYTVLHDEPEGVSKKEYALVGPLLSCIFVGIRGQGKAIIFHKHYTNSMDSLIEIAKDELGEFDPTAIQVTIFANVNQLYEDVLPIVGGKLFRDAPLGKTQRAEIKYIKDAVILGLELSSREQVKASLHASPYRQSIVSNELGEYLTANICVLADSRLNLRSFCYVQEGFFRGKQSPLPFHMRRDMEKRTEGQNARQKVEAIRNLHATLSAKVCFVPREYNERNYGVLPFRKALSNAEMYDITRDFARLSDRVLNVMERLWPILNAEDLRNAECRTQIIETLEKLLSSRE